jgi:UDP-galactopyranose mutase
MKYDYLMVGSGLFGSVFAHLANKAGYSCLVIDKRKHSGGNVFCENVDGINVHKYGAHIFHTNDLEIWNFVNSFVPFNRYTHSVVAKNNGKIYNLPFNMNTFYQLWGVTEPQKAKEIIEKQQLKFRETKPANLEEQAISLVGTDVYETLIRDYTEKQWGRKATDLPPFIIKRLPVRYTFDNAYFNDKYQGIPIGGYNKLTEGLLNGIEVRLEQDYFKDREYYNSLANNIVFTGKIDEYFNFEFGKLQYRSLDFETKKIETPDFQGCSVLNYTDKETPFTRIIEHKHFEFGTQKNTVITKEFPKEWKEGDEPYYPINDNLNQEIYKKYKEKAIDLKNVLFGGRLAEYKYYDMHQVIGSAIKKFKSFEGNQ